jgi:ankyrin repeat protein
MFISFSNLVQSGKTALHLAAERNLGAVATLLLEQGANTNIADKVCLPVYVITILVGKFDLLFDNCVNYADYGVKFIGRLISYLIIP